MKKRIFIAVLTITALIFTLTSNAFGMHIMEGYLPPMHAIIWGVLCLPFLYLGYRSLSKILKENRKAIIILAMVGAYAFVLSALKIPSVTGSSSHPTGTRLGAIIFGPGIMSIISIIVLLFQAILLAHGGLTTLGANTFSMGIAGPFVAFGIYKLLEKAKAPKMVSVFFAATLGNLFTYAVTASQLAVAYPSEVGGVISSLTKFLGIFAVTQIPLAIIEGLVTVIVIIGLESFAKNELNQIGFLKGGIANVK